jgi:hypothetical protein
MTNLQSPKFEKIDGQLISDFCNFFFEFTPYSYQKEFFDACCESKRVAGIWCRQSGKSESVANYVSFQAINKTQTIIIVAPTESQSKELYNKIRNKMTGNPQISKFISKSTETELILNNGSRILSLPSGPRGDTIRGYTADIVIIEEAGIMKDSIVNQVITPMIASKGKKGQLIKIGTPLQMNHFYRSCNNDKGYKVIKVTWRDCIKEGQYAQEFIDEQKEQCTDIEFLTEYEGEFVTDILTFFPISLIEECSLDYNIINNI